MRDIAVSSRVRLARNYADLPFRGRMSREQSALCVQRTLDALRDAPEEYRLFRAGEAEEREKRALTEARLISPELLAHEEEGAVLIRRDQCVSLMMNEEDHLRIQAFAAGENLKEAADLAFSVDDALQRKLAFAFDPQWGYLTACPTGTGTGLRASAVLHLPMLTALQQMGKVHQLAARLGLTLRGVYGEGSEALGQLYQLSNQITLGRTEKEILDAVSAVARQLAEMERAFRKKSLEKDAGALEDLLMRSFGICRYARRMPFGEFMAHYSNLRLGAALEMLPVSLSACDRLLTEAQPGHLQMAAGRAMEEKEIDISRGALVRGALNGGKD